jgi:hypothetical protein
MQRREMRMHVATGVPGEDADLDGLFEAADLIGLGAFGAFDDIELYFVTLFEALVAFALDGAVMDEYVCPAITAEEAVAFCVVEPFYGAFILTHLNELPL